MKYYAVIDTNVLVSAALKWKSVPGSIVDLAFNEVIVPLVNKEILEEYRSVLLRPKFHLTEEIVQDIIDEFVSHALDISEEHLENTWILIFRIRKTECSTKSRCRPEKRKMRIW